jgi:hypothetical protein
VGIVVKQLTGIGNALVPGKSQVDENSRDVETGQLPCECDAVGELVVLVPLDRYLRQKRRERITCRLDHTLDVLVLFCTLHRSFRVRALPGLAQFRNVRFRLNENQPRPGRYLTTQGNVPVWRVGASSVLESPRADRWPGGMSKIGSWPELFQRQFLGRFMAHGMPLGVRRQATERGRADMRHAGEPDELPDILRNKLRPRCPR